MDEATFALIRQQMKEAEQRIKENQQRIAENEKQRAGIIRKCNDMEKTLREVADLPLSDEEHQRIKQMLREIENIRNSALRFA